MSWSLNMITRIARNRTGGRKPDPRPILHAADWTDLNEERWNDALMACMYDDGARMYLDYIADRR